MSRTPALVLYKTFLAPYSQPGSEKPVLEMVNFQLASRAESGASFSSAIPVGRLLDRTQRQEPALEPSALVLFSAVKMLRSQQVLYPRAHQECRTQSSVCPALADKTDPFLHEDLGAWDGIFLAPYPSGHCGTASPCHSKMSTVSWCCWIRTSQQW